MEEGRVRKTIEMYPSTKSKKKTVHVCSKGKLRSKGKDSEKEGDQSDLEKTMGGYDPVVRQLLARAERQGAKMGKKKQVRDGGFTESEDGDSDRGLDSYSSSEEFDRTASSSRSKERGQI